MLIGSIIHIFIRLIGKDSSDFQPFIFRKLIIVCLEFIIIFTKSLNGIYRKKSRVNILPLRMNMLLMMLHDMIYNRLNPFLIMIQLRHINIMSLAIFRVIQLLRIDAIFLYLTGKNCPLILHGKPKHVPVSNRILYHVPMQACIQLSASVEHISGCTPVSPFIFLKNRRTGKTNIICVLEMLLNLSMHLSKLAPVTFINNKDHFLVFISIHNRSILLALYGICHLLNRCHNQLLIRFFQLIDKHYSACRIIHTVFLKAVIFINRLVIQVFPVNQKYNQVYPWLISQKLCQLEAGQRLTRAGTCKHITILIRFQNSLLCSLYRINLIRSHDHQHRFCCLNDHVFIQHFCQRSLPEEFPGKAVQIIDTDILFICPEEHQRFQNGIILSVRHLIFITEIFRLNRI